MSDKAPIQKKQTLTNSFIGALIKMIGALVIALIISILIEIIGMNYWWEDEGVNHSKDMYLYELRHLKNNDQGIDITAEQREFAKDVLVFKDDSLKFLGFEWLSSWITTVVSEGDGPFKSAFRSIYFDWEKYFEAISNVSQVFTLRLIILLLSLPLFLFAFAVGLVDGLVERDLRRWGGGRESSTVYELAKSAIGPTAIGAWMIYLGMPVSVDPSYVIVPFVFLFGFSVRVTTDRLKKYF
jgi:integrating conjugative element membrane protein (TIGR03747 family)